MKLNYEPSKLFWRPATRTALAAACVAAFLGLLICAAAIPYLEPDVDQVPVESHSIVGHDLTRAEKSATQSQGQNATADSPPLPDEPASDQQISNDEAEQPHTISDQEQHHHAHDTLESLGLACGLMALTLLFTQFSLSGRLRFLDRIFGLPRLLTFHRFLGVIAACMALAHPLLVFAPADATIGPIRLEIWPRLLGMATLVALWSVVLFGVYRKLARIPFKQWWILHRLGVHVLVALAVTHALTVSEVFETGWPRAALFMALASYGALFIWRKAIAPLRGRAHPFVVSSVTPVAIDACELTLRPQKSKGFAYAPGQFAFVRLLSQAVDAEEHHFTISSSPGESGSLTFTIRNSGDWTSRVGLAASGDLAILEGPFGLFSHLAWRPERGEELVFIAGGIGVTPMLGMLRHMRRVADIRKVSLVWINRDEAHAVCAQEMRDIEAALPGLTVRHVRTREKDSRGHAGRPDEETLRRYLENVPRSARCFVCGPPAMMEAVVWHLRMLGFRSARIHTERFAL